MSGGDGGSVRVYYNEHMELVSDWAPPQVMSYVGVPDDSRDRAAVRRRIAAMATVGDTDMEIASELGMTRQAVSKCRQRMGVRTGGLSAGMYAR